MNRTSETSRERAAALTRHFGAARPSFLCDAMLVRLGRYLRAAGYDTEIVSPHMRDREVVMRARIERRILLTRDRKMTEHRAGREVVVWLEGDRLETWVAALTERLALDWLLHPFSRCLLCNGPIEPAAAGDRERLPAKLKAAVTDLRQCPRCGKLYWAGSHVRRMAAQLRRWQRREFDRGFLC